MGWLAAFAISATIIFLCIGIVGVFVLLMMWAMDRGRDVEMFVAIVIIVMLLSFTFMFRTVG